MKTIILFILLILAGNRTAFGQGEGLFKAKCNTCHLVNKASTGPYLKGVKQKWIDAGEGDLLYQWVKNSDNLIKSGKSKMAKEIENFSASTMSPQQVTDAEVDQILTYIDNYVEPTPTVTNGDPVTNSEITYTPNYKNNLTIYYALLTLTLVLLIAIIIMSRTIRTFINSDFFLGKLNDKKEKEKASGNDTSGKIVLALLIGFTYFLPSTSFALSPAIEITPENQPWLLIESSDIYTLLVINLILLGVLWYLKNLFNSFYYLIMPHKAKRKRKGKVVKVLVDAVPIEEESSILMDHEYDGIQELDNNLPPWWVWGFVITIFAAVIYLLNYHVFQTGDLQLKAYEKDVVRAQKEVDQYLKDQAMNVDETNATLLADQGDLDAGKAIFTSNCTVCHKSGEGDIGPNLTDKFWIYGNDVKDLFATIKNGTPNGMPDHASKLNPIQIQQAASYVLSLPYKEGKKPQGTEIK